MSTVRQNSNSLDGDFNAVLEPLSVATRTALAPIYTAGADRLWLGLNDEGTEFQIVVFALSPVPTQSFVLRNGERIYSSFYSPSIQALDAIKRIPEVRLDIRTNKRYVAATDVSALVIHHNWPADKLIFADELTENTYRFLIARFLAQTSRAKLTAEFKLNGVVPPTPKYWVDHPALPLAPYQRVATQFSMWNEATGLFMDRGTGKTAATIQRICVEARKCRAEEKRMYRVLVVCPQQVRTNWQNELGRFATVKGKVTVIRGGQLERIRLLTHGIASKDEFGFSAIIASYDSAAIMIRQLTKIPWDLVVLDESHFIKSSATQRWKALIQLRENSKQRMILTGTPIGNSLMDLWAQLEFLGQGLSGYQRFKEFRANHGVFEPSGTGVDRLVGVKNIAIIQERLARLTFSVTKAEAGLNLPDKVYDVYEVEMTPEQADWYNKLADSLTLEIESKLEAGPADSVTIESILTSLLRLAQVTSGFIRTDAVMDSSDPLGLTVLRPKQIRRIDGANPKIEAVIEMVTAEDRDPNGKTIIWCNFVEDIRHLDEALTTAGVKHGTYYGATSERDREAAVTAFNNDPQFKVLICNPQTAGEGLNLLGYNPASATPQDSYCDHEIFFSQNWSAILRAQAEDRAHRRGTKMPLRITDLVVLGTIDEEIRKRVQRKQESANLTLDLREILANVLRIGN